MWEVETGMREKGINNMEVIDREKWIRMKFKLQAQKDVKSLILYT